MIYLGYLGGALGRKAVCKRVPFSRINEKF